MGCCFSSSTPPLSSGTTCEVKSPDPVKPDVNKPIKPVIELPVKPVIEFQENPAVEEAKPIIFEKVEEKEIKHDQEASASGSVAVEIKSSVVRTSSCTKEEVDAILIQCGKLSQSNSSPAAAKTRRYSGSKRSFDVEEEEEERRKTPQRNRVEERVNGSPRERRRRTPSRERERGGGSRRVSRSPVKRSEEATNPRGSLVNSSNNRLGKFVTVPARDKSNNTVKRSIGEACRTASAATMSNVQPQSPYRRRKPLGELDQNTTKGDKKMIKRENESAKPPQVMMSRSRSLRRSSRDFDFSPEALLLLQSREEQDDKSSYTALLLKDIKNFHGGGKSSSHDDEEDPLSLLPSCVTKACSIVEAVADLNSSTSGLNQFRFTSTAVKKADLMEPSFEKYVTLKRG